MDTCVFSTHILHVVNSPDSSAKHSMQGPRAERHWEVSVESDSMYLPRTVLGLWALLCQHYCCLLSDRDPMCCVICMYACTSVCACTGLHMRVMDVCVCV